MSRRVLVSLVVTGAGLPFGVAAQDTASTAERAWIGIRFNLEARVTTGAGQGSYFLVIRDVYGNGPADRVGIRSGDRFVAVNGNPLSTYEAWLRSTSNLGPGQTLRVRLLRDSGEREVAVVADRRPPSFAPDLLYRLEMARFDSLFGRFLEVGPGMAPWPGYPLSHFRLPEGLGMDSATLTLTLNDSGLAAEGSVFVVPGEEPQTSLQRRRRDGNEVETPPGQEVRRRPERAIESGAEERVRASGEQSRSEAKELDPVAEVLADRTPSGLEASPPVAGGGGTELYRVYTDENWISFLTPQLLGSTVVLGGAVVRDLTAELGRYFGVDTGVLVTDVIDATTPAAQAGFRPGDIIVSVEDQPVENLLAFRRVLAEEHPPIKITVIRRKNALKLAYPSR